MTLYYKSRGEMRRSQPNPVSYRLSNSDITQDLMNLLQVPVVLSKPAQKRQTRSSKDPEPTKPVRKILGKKRVDIEIFIDSILGLATFVHDARKLKHMKPVESKTKTSKATARHVDGNSTLVVKTQSQQRQKTRTSNRTQPPNHKPVPPPNPYLQMLPNNLRYPFIPPMPPMNFYYAMQQAPYAALAVNGIFPPVPNANLQYFYPPAVPTPPPPRQLKRCATHVAIAHYILAQRFKNNYRQ